MKIKIIIKEQKKPKTVINGTKKAPTGLLMFGDDKILVGDRHGVPLKMSQDLIDIIIKIGTTHGFYGEGIGYEHNDAITNSVFWPYVKKNGKGSWDDLVTSNNYSDFLYAIFANPEANKRFEKLKSARNNDDTIYDLLQRTKNDWTAKQNHKHTDEDLDNFLKDASNASIPNQNFVKMAQQAATDTNIKRFLELGEAAQWPENWEEYPNNAGKVARRATKIRDMWLINAPAGVYFVGCGHLRDIIKMKNNKNPKSIGGEDC